VFGVAILGIMIAEGNFLAGFHHAVLMAGGVFALAAVLVMLASRHPS
jgi:drug resistance MFS transporter, drug:H+ antiporter-2 (14 spanner) (DHA2) family protein